MPLHAAEAHLICLALVTVDFAARALRLQRILRALGHEVPLARLAATTLTCDAACALTPYRAGGDAVRLASVARAGVPVRRAILAIACEAVQVWPATLLCGTVLAWYYGAAWWGALVTGFKNLAGTAPWSLAAVALSVPFAAWLGWWILRRMRRHHLAAAAGARRERLPRSAGLLRVTIPLTLVSVAARVLILPVLVATLVNAPPFGQSAVGSFALLHSQLILPMPAGAGAVDLGLLAGARHGAHAGLLLLWWRAYTSGIGLAAGLALAPVALSRKKAPAQPSRKDGGPLRRRDPGLARGGAAAQSLHAALDLSPVPLFAQDRIPEVEEALAGQVTTVAAVAQASVVDRTCIQVAHGPAGLRHPER